MPAKKVALFVDVESLHQALRTQHHRPVDPGQLLEVAARRGAIESCVAIADWRALPEAVQASFAEHAGIERVQVDRRLRSREGGGRRREVLRDLVDLELLAQVVEFLFRDHGPEVNEIVLATGDAVVARVIRVVRERLQKEVHVLGVEGALDEELAEAASSCEVLATPAVEPTDLEGLAKLVPLLEELERRKRYLNFKYIRETVARRIDLPERSFERAERLLSEAIAAGLLRKIKVEDKYNPGQLFTAYALDREHALFARYGSGEPAPVHEEREAEAEGASARPRLARPEAEAAPEHAPTSRDEPRVEGEPREAEDAARRRRRRRRRKGAPSNGAAIDDAGEAGPAPALEPLPTPTALSAGAAGARRKKRGAKNHQQDRAGRSYEAPSRFLQDPSLEELPAVRDDEIDEDQILRALESI